MSPSLARAAAVGVLALAAASGLFAIAWDARSGDSPSARLLESR